MSPQGATPVDLAALAELWATPDAPARPVVVGPRAREVAAGNRYLGLPPRRPRVLLPLEGRRAAAGALVGNAALRAPRDRMVRRVLALGIALGVPQTIYRSRWTGLPGGDGPTLLDALRQDWEPRVHALTFTVRAATPNYKPTFVASDRRGHVLGYGKIAPTPSTAARVDREADALETMSAQRAPGLRAPAPVARLRWRSCTVVVVEPLPSHARRYPVDVVAPTPLVGLGLAQGERAGLSEVAAALVERVVTAGDDGVSEAARSCADRVTARYGGATVAVGRTHGDWVPWNVALDGEVVWAWDWEHSREREAVAVDVVHWHQLVARERARLRLVDAVEAAEPRAVRDLAALGLDSEETEVALELGRLHLASRAAELFRDSGRWAGSERGQVVAMLRHTGTSV